MINSFDEQQIQNLSTLLRLYNWKSYAILFRPRSLASSSDKEIFKFFDSFFKKLKCTYFAVLHTVNGPLNLYHVKLISTEELDEFELMQIIAKLQPNLKEAAIKKLIKVGPVKGSNFALILHVLKGLFPKNEAEPKKTFVKFWWSKNFKPPPRFLGV